MEQDRTSVFSADAVRDVKGRQQRHGRLTQAERTAISDTLMFNAAMELIGSQGANRTSLREICEQAGYSRGLANYRFGSKDAFLEQLLKHFNQAWQDRLDVHIGQHRGIQALLGANRALESFLRDNASYMRGGYLIWYENIGGDNPVVEKLRHNHETYRQDVARWIREGIDDGEIDPAMNPTAFGHFYCSWVFGTIFQWLAEPHAVDLDASFTFARWLLTTRLQHSQDTPPAA